MAIGQCSALAGYTLCLVALVNRTLVHYILFSDSVLITQQGLLSIKSVERLDVLFRGDIFLKLSSKPGAPA
jgi:hypothetical protein